MERNVSIEGCSGGQLINWHNNQHRINKKLLFLKSQLIIENPMNLSHLLKLTESRTNMSCYIDADDVKNIIPCDYNGEHYTNVVCHDGVTHSVKETPEKIYQMMESIDYNRFDRIMDFLGLH